MKTKISRYKAKMKSNSSGANFNNRDSIRIFWTKIVMPFAIIFVSFNSYAQTIGYLTDAIRNTDNTYNSSARSMSLGNAVSSLGGDFGTITINPASMAVYQRSELIFSPGMLSFSNPSTYNNSRTNQTETKFTLSSLGLVMTKKNNDDSEWKNYNIAFGYNKITNHNNFFNIRGTTTNTTLMNEFISYANGKPFYNLDSYFESLAFNLGIIDTIPGYPTSYWSPYQTIPLLQQRNIDTRGSVGEYTFGIGANFMHMLYLGFSLNVRSGYYEDEYNHRETDIENQLNDSYYLFNYRLNTQISGWNAKLGLIYRPIEQLRLGLSIHTPTIIRINQEMDIYMKVVEDNGNTYYEYPRDSYGNIVGKLIDNYTITSPFRTVLGISYLFEDKGLISIDYEYCDYSQIKISNADVVEIEDETNQEISNRLKAVNSIRFGGEIKINSFYIRGGYAYTQSPFKKNELNDNAHTQLYTSGIGYRGKSAYIDFGYSLTQKKEKYFMYDDANLNAAELKSNISQFLITVGLRF